MAVGPRDGNAPSAAFMGPGRVSESLALQRLEEKPGLKRADDDQCLPRFKLIRRVHYLQKRIFLPIDIRSHIEIKVHVSAHQPDLLHRPVSVYIPRRSAFSVRDRPILLQAKL